MLYANVSSVAWVNRLGFHCCIDQFVTWDDHWFRRCDERVATWDVLPCVNQRTLSIEDLDVSVSPEVVHGSDCHEAGTVVDLIIGLLIIEFDFNRGRIDVA